MSMTCIQHVEIDPARTLPEGYESRNLVAHSIEKCAECGRPIIHGEPYLLEVGTWADATLTFRTCADCRSMRGSFFGAGFVYGELWRSLADHVWDSHGEIGEVHLACLTPLARTKVCDMIEEVWRNE